MSCCSSRAFPFLDQVYDFVPGLDLCAALFIALLNATTALKMPKEPFRLNPFLLLILDIDAVH
jgi:hypothetical protein